MTGAASLPGSLFPDNIATFTALLRSRGLPVGTAELIDALQALGRVDLCHRAHFRAALQSTLVKSRADEEVFASCFDLFFCSYEEHLGRAAQVEQRRDEDQEQLAHAEKELFFQGETLGLNNEELRRYRSLSSEQRSRLQDFMQKTENGVNVETAFKPLLETVVKSHLRFCRSRRREEETALARAQASPGAGKGEGSSRGDKALREADIEAIASADLSVAEELMAALARRLARKILRRRRSGPRRGGLDLRRSLRDNMRYGGVIFQPRQRPQRRRKEDFVMLCDVSASMTRYSSFAMSFINGLRLAVPRLSCFLLSDSLEEVHLADGRRGDLAQLLDRIVRRSGSWGGGTDLGQGLRTFNGEHVGRFGHRTTVVLVSDTKTVALDRALTEVEKLQNQVRRLIWLNPLPPEDWGEHRSVEEISSMVEMWPCNTIARLEEALAGRL